MGFDLSLLPFWTKQNLPTIGEDGETLHVKQERNHVNRKAVMT